MRIILGEREFSIEAVLGQFNLFLRLFLKGNQKSRFVGSERVKDRVVFSEKFIYMEASKNQWS